MIGKCDRCVWTGRRGDFEDKTSFEEAEKSQPPTEIFVYLDPQADGPIELYYYCAECVPIEGEEGLELVPDEMVDIVKIMDQ